MSTYQSSEFYKQSYPLRTFDGRTQQQLSNIKYPPQRFPQYLQAQPFLQIPQYPQYNWPAAVPAFSSFAIARPLDLSMRSQVLPNMSIKPVCTCIMCIQSLSLHGQSDNRTASQNTDRGSYSVTTRYERSYTGVKPYDCATCSQVFSKFDDFITHRCTGTRGKVYHCPACSYVAHRSKVLSHHMKRHPRQMLEAQAKFLLDYLASPKKDL